MSEEKNFSFTEAGIGLSLITCLLLGLGFAVIHRIGASPRPPELPTTFSSVPQEVRTAPAVDANQPAEHQAAYAPQWLEPQPASDDTIVR